MQRLPRCVSWEVHAGPEGKVMGRGVQRAAVLPKSTRRFWQQKHRYLQNNQYVHRLPCLDDDDDDGVQQPSPLPIN
jgi:hypothetical protein